MDSTNSEDRHDQSHQDPLPTADREPAVRISLLERLIRPFRSRRTRVSRELADDFGLPHSAVARLLDEAAAELRTLSANDDSVDARPIIHKAVSGLAKLGIDSRSLDECAMDRCLEQLDQTSLTILRHFNEGMSHADIAALVGTDVEGVIRSLVRTYTELRMKMIRIDGGDGPGNGVSVAQVRETYSDLSKKQARAHGVSRRAAHF